MHLESCEHIARQLSLFIEFFGTNDEVVDVAPVFSNLHISLVLHCDWVWAIFTMATNSRLSVNAIAIAGRLQWGVLLRSPGEN